MTTTPGLLGLVAGSAGAVGVEVAEFDRRPTFPASWIRARSERAGRGRTIGRIVHRVARRAPWAVRLVEACATSRETAGVAVYFAAFVVHLYDLAGGDHGEPSPREVAAAPQGAMAGPNDAQPELLNEVASALQVAGDGRLDELGRAEVLALVGAVVELLDRCWTPPERPPWVPDR